MIDMHLEKSLFGPEGRLTLRVSCHLEKGAFVGLYGPSGVGKSSVLRMISGLMKPEAGQLKVAGEVWFSSEQQINLRPNKRNIGMVFQEHSLFPNMTVRQNLEFALEKGQQAAIVDELLEQVELANLADKKPITLSGGQKQRVALARAMVRKPGLLLLDEPFSALDMKMRGNLQEYLMRFHQAYGLTTLLVSHDASEIGRMAQRVLVMEHGTFSFDGPPEQFFSR
ncbi:ABC transporter ATP-binding protein [Cyclobacterium xiamenense]|jgi:molybdate transport system ATP-binding protein|uniref:ABC transporter ATP-binding protein n=1 Tax=Cyclobacterium xiamenense TaxID=1297121 RepID=UPI0035D064E5